MAFGSQANLTLRATSALSARLFLYPTLVPWYEKGAHSRQAVEAETSKSAVC